MNGTKTALKKLRFSRKRLTVNKQCHHHMSGLDVCYGEKCCVLCSWSILFPAQWSSAYREWAWNPVPLCSPRSAQLLVAFIPRKPSSSFLAQITEAECTRVGRG